MHHNLHHITIHRGRIAALCSVCALSAEGQYPVASHAITLTGAAAEKSICGFSFAAAAAGTEGSESVATEVVVVVCQLEISFTLVECAPVSFTAPLPCSVHRRRLLLVKDRVPSCRVRECSPCRPLGYKSERNCSLVASLSWDLNRCGNPEFVQSW